MIIPLILFIVFIGVVWAAQNYTKKYAFKGISYKQETSKLLLSPGEPFKLITTISNHNLRIVPFISVHNKLADDTVYNYKVYLMPRAKLVRRIENTLPARGRYLFSGVNISGGDFLGLSTQTKWFESKCEVVVYPAEATGNYIDRVVGSFLGDISVMRFIMPDPMLVTGFSEYTGREPMKSIAWSQTLRANQMMVKNYDYTKELNATVVVSLDFLSDTDEVLPKDMPDLVEKCLSIAHTICKALDKHNISYDFYSNMITGGASGWDYVKAGSGKNHFSHILEGLGRAILFKSEPLEKLAMRVAKAQTRTIDKAVIFIVPNQRDKVLQILNTSGKGLKMVTVISADQL